MEFFSRKKHRLDPNCYKGTVRVTITICIKDKKEVFINDDVYNKVLAILKDTLKKERIINLAYVFMPDHIHFIIEGKDESSNVLKAVKIFKQKSGYWLKHNVKIEWQKSFYDYVHRKDDDLKKHIKYIFKNPLRKKLVEDFNEYKYLGSLNFSIEELL